MPLGVVQKNSRGTERLVILPKVTQLGRLSSPNLHSVCLISLSECSSSCSLTLLYPSDVNMEAPDEKSIITYVVSFYHYFSKMKALAVEGKRIGKVHRAQEWGRWEPGNHTGLHLGGD